MEENYYALALAILKPVTPEQAFQIISGQKSKREITTSDIEKMIKMKSQGMTYKQIGEIYGLSAHAVYARIGRAKGRLKS